MFLKQKRETEHQKCDYRLNIIPHIKRIIRLKNNDNRNENNDK
jgi:hypothetical protein